MKFPKLTKAEQWLVDYLPRDAPVLASDVLDHAVIGGIPLGTIYRAKKSLGIISVRPRSLGPWYWAWPKSWTCPCCGQEV